MVNRGDAIGGVACTKSVILVWRPSGLTTGGSGVSNFCFLRESDSLRSVAAAAVAPRETRGFRVLISRGGAASGISLALRVRFGLPVSTTGEAVLVSGAGG